MFGPYGFTIDDHNTLYIAEYSANRIVKWVPGALTGTVVLGSSTGSQGNGSSEFNRPVEPFLESNGDMYITDRSNDRLQFWPKGASSATTVLGIGFGSNGTLPLRRPSGIVRDPETGLLYITATSNGLILRYPPEALVFNSNASGSIDSQLMDPIGLIYDTYSKSLVIANHRGHAIVRLKPGNDRWTPIAGSMNISGNTSSLLKSPVGITMDVMGNIYCADSLNHRIQLFLDGQSEGITIAGITGVNGSSSTLLYSPFWVKLDNQLNLYVADTYNNRIQKFSRY